MLPIIRIRNNDNVFRYNENESEEREMVIVLYTKQGDMQNDHRSPQRRSVGNLLGSAARRKRNGL